MLNKDPTRFMQSLSRERQNRSSKRKALLAGWLLPYFLEKFLPACPQSLLVFSPRSSLAALCVFGFYIRLFREPSRLSRKGLLAVKLTKPQRIKVMFQSITKPHTYVNSTVRHFAQKKLVGLEKPFQIFLARLRL